MGVTGQCRSVRRVSVRWFRLMGVAVGLSGLFASAGCSRSEPADAQLENIKAENNRLRQEIEQLKKLASGPPKAGGQVQSRSGSILDGSGKAKAFEFVHGVRHGQPRVTDPKNLVFMKEVQSDFVFVSIDEVTTIEIGKDVDVGRTSIKIKTKDGKQESHQAIAWWPIEVKWKGETAIHEIPVERLLNGTITFDK